MEITAEGKKIKIVVSEQEYKLIGKAISHVKNCPRFEKESAYQAFLWNNLDFDFNFGPQKILNERK